MKLDGASNLTPLLTQGSYTFAIFLQGDVVEGISIQLSNIFCFAPTNPAKLLRGYLLDFLDIYFTLG